jgi:hypothetical protein
MLITRGQWPVPLPKSRSRKSEAACPIAAAPNATLRFLHLAGLRCGLARSWLDCDLRIAKVSAYGTVALQIAIDHCYHKPNVLSCSRAYLSRSRGDVLRRRIRRFCLLLPPWFSCANRRRTADSLTGRTCRSRQTFLAV